MDLDRDLRSLFFALVRADGWVSGDELGLQLGWGRKKVQQGVAELRRLLEGECVIEAQRRLGYRLSELGEELREDILRDELFNEAAFHLDERRAMLALDLLLRADYVSMEELAARYFLAKTTVFEEVRQLRRWFGRMEHLELEVSGTRGLRVVGSELAKRFACVSFGQMHILRMVGISFEELRQVEACQEEAARLLREELLAGGPLLSGEEYVHIVRYVGFTRLRDLRGFAIELPEGTEELPRYPFLDTLSTRMETPLTPDEAHAISLLIAYSDVVARVRPATEERKLVVEGLERFVIDAFQLETDRLFSDRDVVAANVAAALGRHARANHRAQYYDREVIRDAPLCLHVASRAFAKICGVQLSRYERINMGILLGGASMRYRRRSGVRALLVGNQDFEVLDQLRSRVLERLPLAPAAFELLPVYAFEGQEADLLLTTSPAFALEHPAFAVVPPIVTDGNRERLWQAVDTWLADWREALTQRIWDKAELREITAAHELSDIVPETVLREATVTPTGKGRLLVLATCGCTQTGVVLTALGTPLVHDYHQISEVALLNHRPDEPDVIEWFDAAIRGL